MRSVILLSIMMFFPFLIVCKGQTSQRSLTVIGQGQIPALVKDDRDNLYLAYGSGDSIMYAQSVDHGRSFSAPALVASLPKLFSTAMRGPQIAFTGEGVTIIASDKRGDIYSYWKDRAGNWKTATRVNDADTVAKEGLMALSGDGKTLFAVWLDLRGNKRNKIVGARSVDGGKTWSKNILVYASPDATVCECCKPSVAVKGNNVYVMFRNWLKGNRDLYLIQSSDGGKTFGEARKLGNDSWALNGCPMDGGGLAINNTGTPQTVWRRKNTIYACEPGAPEIAIGEGRSCTIESVNGKNVYAWTQNGDVVILHPGHEKKVIGKGSLPVMKAINNDQVLCVWENKGEIQSSIVTL